MFGPIFLQYNFDKLHFALKKKKNEQMKSVSPNYWEFWKLRRIWAMFLERKSKLLDFPFESRTDMNFYSKCGPRAGCISIPWELVRNGNS